MKDRDLSNLKKQLISRLTELNMSREFRDLKVKIRPGTLQVFRLHPNKIRLSLDYFHNTESPDYKLHFDLQETGMPVILFPSNRIRKDIAEAAVLTMDSVELINTLKDYFKNKGEKNE